MNPDLPESSARFALLATGASFSCEVLQALVRNNYLPDLLVLPEYPPANSSRDAHNLVCATTPRRLTSLTPDIEVAYAPAPLQAECASLIRRRNLEFLLVACWPYLIEESISKSVRNAALNLHPSLLPRYRGANPLEQQLATVDTRFGVTLHLLDQHFDHGDIIAQAELPGPQKLRTVSILEACCAGVGVELFIDAVNRYPHWSPVAQSD